MSRDIKGTSLNELNDGLERAVARCKNQLTQSIANAERNAVNSAVRISNNNLWQARQELQTRINNASSQLNSRIENAQRNLGARIDENARRFAANLNAIDLKHTRALNDLNKAISKEIEAQDKYIESQVNRIDNNIGMLANGLNEMSRGMSDLAKRTNQRFQEQQKEIISIQNDIKNIFQRQENDTNSKLLAAGAALALLNTIRERTNVDKFSPKHMLDSVSLKEERLKNIKNNPDSCTITDANNLIDEALVMENEAIRRQNEWEPVHQALLASAEAILKLLQTSENIKVQSLYDENEEEELKVDYWTHGKYKKLLKEVETLKIEIENAPVDMQKLADLQKEVDTKQHQAEKLIIEAAELGTLSEQRVIVSNDILNSMVNQGWELQGEPDFMGGQEESDWREGTFAVLRKPNTGEEVSVLVLPEEKDGKKGNQIIFHRNDDLKESAGAFQSRMEEIKREIEKSGYKLGALKEPGRGDGKIEQLRDKKSMRKKGAAQELQTTLSKR